MANLCALCGNDFASLSLFDQHFVGKPGDRQRGCLTSEQMQACGWEVNARGYWSDPVAAQRARDAFRQTAEVAQNG